MADEKDTLAASWLFSLAGNSDEESDYNSKDLSDNYGESDEDEGSLESVDLKDRVAVPGHTNLPRRIRLNSASIDFFSLFFTSKVLRDIVTATNEYARTHQAVQGIMSFSRQAPKSVPNIMR